MIVIALVFLIVAGLAGIGIIATSGGGSGWSDSSLQVVGDPITSGGRVLLLNVSQSHALQLTAVNPVNGDVQWQLPFSASEITPGVAFGPTALGSTVIDLEPGGKPNDPAVRVEGVNILTGQVRWAVPQAVVLSDAPEICVGGRFFCITPYTSDTSSSLVSLNPSTGSVIGAIAGIERTMAIPLPGQNLEGTLWETTSATPTFSEVSPTGQLAWTKSVAGLFGSTQFDPNNGWDFLVTGNLDIGSLGLPPSGNTLPLGGSKTVGIASSNGTVQWSVPGAFQCGGGLAFLTPPVVCLYSGSAQRAGDSFTMKGVTLTLEGINPETGATTWSKPVLGAKALSLGTDVAFANADQLAVQLTSGERVLLNAATGAISPLPANGVYWCEQIPPFYKVTTAQGASVGGKRQGAPVFAACSASGSPASAIPAAGPSAVGVDDDGLFIWATPHGLQAARLSA